MAKWLALAFALGMSCSQLHAQTDWFTVSGNPLDPAVDTVQVDPVAVSASNGRKTMKVRVSRAGPRISSQGVPYRSFEAQVVFDCRARTARYLTAAFYMAPSWQGPSHRTTDYTGNARPMSFRDIEPNPSERILSAACPTELGLFASRQVI